MYYAASKSFKTFKEAVEGILESSFSLSGSDLTNFNIENFDELPQLVQQYKKEEYNWARVFVGSRDNATKYLTRDDDQIDRDDNENEAFTYSTVSGTNNIFIWKLQDEYITEYIVSSSRPFEYSSSMNDFSANGWYCDRQAYHDLIGMQPLTEEEMKRVKDEYEEKLICELREDKSVPDLYRYTNEDNPKYVTTLLTLLKNHPEVAEDAILAIEEQIRKCPEDEEEMKKSLIELKDTILGRENSKTKSAILAATEDITPGEVAEILADMNPDRFNEKSH